MPFDEERKNDILITYAKEIYTEEDICKFLKMGAAVARRETCFVATRECDAGEFASVHPENPGGQ